jgi:beta-glucosidase
VGYGAAEGGRDYNATEIGLPTLRNIYLPPFKAGVDAGALSIMSAFNSLNGIPASGNRHLLTDVLRNEWKFTGMVVSDWDSILNMVRLGYAADAAEAAQLGITAGVDLEMVSHTYGDHLAALIARGDVSQAMLDEAVRRILRFKLRCGLFDKPYAKEVTQPFPRPESLALAREAAARSCVLVKNAGNILPLPTGKRIALIGPFAESRDLLGCWSRTGNLDQVVTLAEGLRTAMGAENLTVVRGCASTGQDTSGFSAAITAAKAADLVIMAVGESSELSGEAHSRQELDLPGNQGQLLAQISDTGTPIVVVLFTGRPLAIPDVVARSSAVLIAWHPGMQGGHGIADLLTGKSEPTGRLSASWPRTVGQIPVHYNRPPVGHGGGKPGSYLDELGQYKDGSPESLFAFGAGLGYANFSLTTPVLDRSHLTPGGAVTATATVRNTGKRRGQTVVQCYLRDHAARGGQRPLKELKGFTHITLDPGEERAVSFAFDPERLSYWLPNGQKVAEAGQFTIWISLDSQLGAGASLTLEKP